MYTFRYYFAWRPSPGLGGGRAFPEAQVSSPFVTVAGRLAVRLVLLTCLLTTAGLTAPGAHAHHAVAPAAPAHHLEGGFRNVNPEFARPSTWRRAWSLIGRIGPALRGDFRFSRLAAAAPAEDTTPEPGSATVTWIGHSTLLVRLDGVTFLTDPHWGERAGPFGGSIGASRYTPPGLRFDELPPIDFVLISHDHYDHLDEPTVVNLARVHNPRFVVPLGLKGWLADRGIRNAVELDWGETVTIGGLTVVCTPAQHYSGRTLADQGRRLWASWAVLGTKRFYFAGDSGYSRHFGEIGAAFGPFDLAAMPIGSYTPRATTRAIHTSPDEALQGWLDLRAARFIAIHWGTFALAHEPSDEPPRQLAADVQRRRLDPQAIWVPKPGETRAW
jgi:N-acyl-phosphatidylethanolamine-hydrolysing phospholipase D